MRLIGFTIFIGLFFNQTVIAQVPNYVPTDSLKGWWPFNGNAKDESGKGNHGNINGATLTTDRYGGGTRAYFFDGIDDYIVTNSNDLPTNSTISISVWIKPNQNNGIAEYICLGSPSSTTWGTLAGTNWNGSPYQTMNYGRGCSGSGTSNVAKSPILNVWQNITYVSSGVGGICKVYVNGSFIGQASNGTIGGCSNSKLYFGVDIFGPNYINCLLDDIAIWSRALDSNEVKSLYYGNFNQWSGTGNISSTSNWISGRVPGSTDSVHVVSGTMTVNQSTTLDVLRIHNGATVKLSAPLTVRNLYIKNGTLDLNGQKLTVTGKIIQSMDSANYYIQAGTSASPKPRSELVINPTTAQSSTVYFNPDANRLNRFEIGNGNAVTQISLGNSLKIKGGEDGGTGPGLLTIKKNSKILLPWGAR